MHPRLEELFAHASLSRDELLARVREVRDDEKARRPAEGRWSVAEHLEHLALVEAGSARLVARLIEKARAAGLGPDGETDSLLHALDRFGLEDGRRRIDAPDIVFPQGARSVDESLASLGASREALFATYRDADGLDLTQVKARHAALGELDLYEWLLFLSQHERRHARHIAETVEQLRA
jgi:hypothetical protein